MDEVLPANQPGGTGITRIGSQRDTTTNPTTKTATIPTAGIAARADTATTTTTTTTIIATATTANRTTEVAISNAHVQFFGIGACRGADQLPHSLLAVATPTGNPAALMVPPTTTVETLTEDQAEEGAEEVEEGNRMGSSPLHPLPTNHLPKNRKI